MGWILHRSLSPWLHSRLLWLFAAHLVVAAGVQQLTNPRIIEHPEDQFVAKNEPATLNCKAEGDPPPLITWYRDGRPVITANENPGSHRMLLPSGQLFFLRIIHNKNNKPDVGVYYCNATNPETKVSVISRNATLDIAVMRDDFREHPRNMEVAVGNTATLECRPPKGQPEPYVRWQKDGENIRPGGRVTVREAGTLLIHDARESDSGIYVCIAHNIAGEKESSPARLMVREKPRILKAPQDVTVEEGRDIQFQCQAGGDPSPNIVWKREEGQVPERRAQVQGDSSLKLTNVRVVDEGMYICRAENSVGFVEALAKLTVHSEPSFMVIPRNKVVGVGRRVSFRCEVLGNPPPAVFWSKETNQVLMFPRQDNGRFSVTDDGTLVIEPVHKDDAGEYMCQALSVAGSAITKARLEVKDVDPRPPPIIHQGPQNQTLPINSVAMLQCSASGDPPPSIRWYKNNRVLALRDPRFALLDSGTLQISDLRRTDTGMYTCKAMSETGETAWPAALIVEAPTNPSVIFHRTPEPSTFPGPPSKPSISDVTDSSMRLSWKSNPNHGASPVFAYTVEYFSHETGEGWEISSDMITEQTHVVRHLEPGTAYMFLVRAQNSHGLSLPSQVTAPIRTQGVSRVLTPTVPQLDIGLVSEKLTGQVVYMKQPEVISSTAIKLNWEVRKSHRFIEGFHIKYRVMPALQDHMSHSHHHHIEFTIETVTSGTATMYVLRNLQKYKWYEIRVQPFYLTVEGQESNTVRVRTYEDIPSTAPANIKASLLDNTTLHLSWEPPPQENHNGPLSGYRIYIVGNETKFSRELDVNSSVKAIIVNHLVKGMTYRLQLAAHNRMGQGPKSDPVLVGGKDSQGLMHGFVKEPWFIATLIGTVGGTLWFALCVFSIWLYRKKRGRKKYQKNGVMCVPVHKSEDTSRLGTLFNTLNAPNYLQKDIENHADTVRPDVTNMCERDQLKEEPLKENLYNVPSPNQPGPMKTFYNKAHAMAPVAPYATTTLINAGAPSPQQQQQQPHADSAFRPIHKGYVQQGSGSSDSCQKQPDNSSNSSTDNNRSNADLPPDYCTQCDVMGPGCECGAVTADEDGIYDCRQPLMDNRGPVLFLPPPPEHPPPSDIGTPPDSPTHTNPGPHGEYSMAGRFAMPPGGHSPHPHNMSRPPSEGSGHYPRTMYADRDYPRVHNSTPGVHGVERGQFTPKTHAHPQHTGMNSTGGGCGAGMDNNSPPSPRFRTMSPRTQHDARAYSPRAMSEPERGPTPPIRGYKLVPIRDEVPRHYSDTEGAPVPPLRMMVPRSPPSPAPEDPMMDRGIQSSLPSLVNEPCNNSRLHHHPSGDHDDPHRPDSPVSEYVGDSDGEGQLLHDCTPESSIGDGVDTVAGSMLASWASVTDNSDCSSVRTSAASSSDGSFYAEADFASAVAKAAKLSGLTVVGSTVTDPNAGSRGAGDKEKVKKSAKHRQRAKRPTSPYSTDSNYSCVPVQHKPYPKSERKKQLLEHGNRRPPVKSKPQLPTHVTDMPSYSKPSFPVPYGANVTNGSMQGRGYGARIANANSNGATTQSGTETDQLTVRTNPLAAFDTSDTPIV